MPVIKPGELIIFDYNVEGDADDVDRADREDSRPVVQSHPNMECLGTEGVQEVLERSLVPDR